MSKDLGTVSEAEDDVRQWVRAQLRWERFLAKAAARATTIQAEPDTAAQPTTTAAQPTTAPAEAA